MPRSCKVFFFNEILNSKQRRTWDSTWKIDDICDICVCFPDEKLIISSSPVPPQLGWSQKSPRSPLAMGDLATVTLRGLYRNATSLSTGYLFIGMFYLEVHLEKKTVLYMIRLILVEWQNLLNQACHLLFLTLGNNGVQWRKSWCRHLRSGSVGQLVWKGVKVSHKHRETSRCHFVHVCSLENEEPDSEKSRWKNTRFVFVYCLSVINGYVKRKHPRIWF